MSRAHRELQASINGMAVGLLNSKRFVNYGGSREIAAQIDALADDIEADILPVDPAAALSLAEKLLGLDAKLFERADDSGGSIDMSLRNACMLWLSAAAATREVAKASSAPTTDWLARVYDPFKDDDYGIREALLRESSRLVHRASDSVRNGIIWTINIGTCVALETEVDCVGVAAFRARLFSRPA